MPALMGRYTKDQERMILAVLDPIAALAVPVPEKQLELLSLLETSSGPVAELLRNLTDETELLLAIENFDFEDADDPDPELASKAKATMFKVYIYTDSQYEDIVSAVSGLIKKKGFDAEVTL